MCRCWHESKFPYVRPPPFSSPTRAYHPYAYHESCQWKNEKKQTNIDNAVWRQAFNLVIYHACKCSILHFTTSLWIVMKGNNRELLFTFKNTVACLEVPVAPPSIPTELYTSVVYNSLVCLSYAITTGFWQLSCGIHVLSALFLHPPLLHAVLTANLYSDIKPDDSPVKGTKRGKGKKKKMQDPFEKKKPKLDELKVRVSVSMPQPEAILIQCGLGLVSSRIKVPHSEKNILKMNGCFDHFCV